jgi:hypothetical protein
VPRLAAAEALVAAELIGFAAHNAKGSFAVASSG